MALDQLIVRSTLIVTPRNRVIVSKYPARSNNHTATSRLPTR